LAYNESPYIREESDGPQFSDIPLYVDDDHVACNDPCCDHPDGDRLYREEDEDQSSEDNEVLEA
jgi:hypothetical protein